METVLRAAVRSSNGLRPGKDKLWVKQLQKTWSTIKEDYKQYRTKVRSTVDFYQTICMILNPSKIVQLQDSLWK